MGLTGTFTDLAKSITIASQAAADLAPKISSVADAAKKLADAQKQLAADQQNIAERTMMHTRALGDNSSAMIKNTADAAAWGTSLAAGSKITGQAIIDMSGLNDKLREAASNALAAADAFGRIANGLTQVGATADNATAGLQGVAWEVRHATTETVTFNAEQTKLIESLAKVSDEYGKTSLWVGHLIAEFEKGSISIDDFRKQLAAMLIGMGHMPGAFGSTSVEMQRLLTILADFKNTASGGWPVGTTTAPYSNPSNPLTGKP
jgi:hypothetical protein